MSMAIAPNLVRSAASPERLQSRRWLVFLADITEALSRCFDFPAELASVTEQSVPEVADWCAVELLDGGELRPLVMFHADAEKAELARELRRRHPPREDLERGVWNVVRKGKSELYEELDGELHLGLERTLGLGSVMILPLKACGRVLGVLRLGLSDGRACYNAADLAMAEELAARCATALDAAQLRAQLEQAQRERNQAVRERDQLLQERRKVEEEVRRHADFVERLIGVLGHDLRSPLQAISASAHLLLRRGLPESQNKAAARIAGSAERMGRLITDLLDFTRTRLGGGLPVTRGYFCLPDVMREIVEEMEMSHPGRRVTIDASDDPCGHWDRDRIAQLISNLVGNAILYGKRDAPVRITLQDEGGDVVFSIHNEGTPIPPALLPRVFEPFRRAESGNDAAARSKGLGLGLYIARQIVQAHGGDISVRSTEADGTTFTVRLPKGAKPCTA